MEKRAKDPYMERLSKSLHLPPDILAGSPILTSYGNRQLYLENYKGIIEYTATMIKVQTKICKVSIEGSKLNIDYFTEDEMRISGCIKQISYYS